MANNKKTKEKDDLIKKRIFDIIQIGKGKDFLSKLFDCFIGIVIVVCIVVTFLRTFESLRAYEGILISVEAVTIVVFIAEYVLRLYTCEFLYPQKTKIQALFSFVFSFYGIVDLLTIISFFAPLYSNGFVVFRMIRVVRILRLFKVTNTFDAFSVVAGVLEEKRNQIFSSLFMTVMLMFAASMCMYGLEHDAQPDKFTNAFSGIWWAMSTVLTVGYGDIYPITIGGQIVAIVIALLGVCVVAIPTGVISAGLVEYYSRLKTANGDIHISEDVAKKLRILAKHEGLSVDTYVEKMILDKFD